MPISTPRYLITGAVAGVTLVDGVTGAVLRAFIMDGDRFGSEWRGSIKISPEGTTHVKTVRTINRARRFGVRLDQCPVALWITIKAAINAALNAGTTFRVQLQDEANAIDVQAAPDFSLGNWLDHDAEGSFGGKVKTVVLRFISTGNGA